MIGDDVHFIILAQGTQQRMGGAHGFKQLLPLPDCGGAPILIRTLRQLERMSGAVTIVTWDALLERVPPAWRWITDKVGHLQLPDPGNSSLKGVARCLELGMSHAYGSTVVLLGDVVYSWACLSAVIRMADSFGFVGTSNLSSGAGELWGAAWHHRRDDSMRTELRDALLRHPPFDDTYQPGQLRRWLVGWRRGAVSDSVTRLSRTGNYLPIDDYTMDVDLPHHIPLLERASVYACADDTEHGLLWGAT